LPVEEKRLQVVKIHSDEIKALVPAGHPLADNTQILPEDLVPHQILLPKTGTTRRRLASWFAAVEDDLNVSMELDSTEMIKRFVAAGLGVSFLAGTHCADEVAAGTLKAISLGPEHMVRQLALIYRKDKPLSKAALGFIEVTLKNAAIDGYGPGAARAKGK
jgi:DNA-binding transcriptional LysR family regulator